MVEVPGDEEEEVLTDESQSSKGIVSSVVGHVSLSKRISSSIKKVMLASELTTMIAMPLAETEEELEAAEEIPKKRRSCFNLQVLPSVNCVVILFTKQRSALTQRNTCFINCVSDVQLVNQI